MTHLEAQNRIKGCHDHLTLSVSRCVWAGWAGDVIGVRRGASQSGELSQPSLCASLRPNLSIGAVMVLRQHWLELGGAFTIQGLERFAALVGAEIRS
jgi:hypothetical protein